MGIKIESHHNIRELRIIKFVNNIVMLPFTFCQFTNWPTCCPDFNKFGRVSVEIPFVVSNYVVTLLCDIQLRNNTFFIRWSTITNGVIKNKC